MKKYDVYVKLEACYPVETEDDWQAEDKVRAMIENDEINPILDTEHEPWELRVDLHSPMFKRLLSSFNKKEK